MTHTTSFSKIITTILKPACVALLIVGALCAGAWAVAKAGASRVAALPQSEGAGKQARADKQTAEVERVALTRFGFNPLKISRARGRFLLAVDDRSGLDDVSISLVRVQGEKLHDVKAKKWNPRWNSLLDLPPGDYRLVEAGHPEWTCEITITPN